MYLGGLCFITDRSISKLSYEEMSLAVLKTGVKWIQYREKDKTRKDMYGDSVKIREITKDYGAVFIVNDYVDIALSVDADGVHLGQDDLPIKEARRIMGGKKIIGISTHNVEQAIAAEAEGADYIGFGPVFHTTTKDAGKPKGTEMLQEVKTHVHIPVVAIGGIDLGNLKQVLDTGVDAVAVSSAILRGDIEAHGKNFMEIIASTSLL
jgi:thiamine-phosphate pyrophosphorylase